MRSSLLIGRFGPLTISLNYTWLFISVLGLWGLAFIWLPDNYPQWPHYLTWIVAALVMILYLASLILRELVRALVAGFDRRGIVLYPFGAATPYRLDEIGTGRVLASMFASLLFSLLLGGLLMFVSNSIPSGNEVGDFARAILIPLAWLNLWVGIINLIPGIPFDGGRALTSTLFWFSGQREQGLDFTRTVGEITSLGLVLVGAWKGLTSQDWIVALVLVVIGWGAREAEEKGKQLGMLRTGLAEITARDIMEKADPQDVVSADASVAKMVLSHPYYASDKPLAVMRHQQPPVTNNVAQPGLPTAAELPAGTLPAGTVINKGEEGEMVGLVTLSKADDLLQGDWPTTPVLSLMTAPSEVESFAPDTPLTKIVEMIEARGSDPAEQTAIPVIDNGRLVGSVDPAKLTAFEQAELELGAAEAPTRDAEKSGFFARLQGIVPALALVIALAIMGNIAINSDPYSIRNVRQADSDIPLTFTQTEPLPDALIAPDLAAINIKAVAISVQPVTTASLTLDGKAIEVSISGPNPLQPNITSQAPRPADGLHTLTLVVADRLGRLGRTEWQFWVGMIGTPTPQPGVDTLQIVQHRPAAGGSVLAGSDTPTTVGLVVAWGQTVAEGHLLVDGKETPTNVENLSTTGQYYLSAQVTGLQAGSHTVRATIKGSSGALFATDWTFFAALPDDQHIYFKETGFFVSRDFYDYWNSHGGLDIFGFPISDRIQETAAGTGEVYTAQYFQRARLELHPSMGNAIMLGSLGTLVHPPDPPALALKDAQYFPESGHNLSGPFLEFWQTRGGLEIFGYPISEAITETNIQDGKDYLVQYFERAKFDLHPDLAGTPYEVQLAQLGVLVYGGK